MNTAEENNKLIAEFMEHKPTFEVYIDDVLTTLERPVKNYNSDWNWLMEVVEKIEEFSDWSIECLDIDGVKNYQVLIYLSNTNIIGNNKIEAVYNACVTFINLYNENAVKN